MTTLDEAIKEYENVAKYHTDPCSNGGYHHTNKIMAKNFSQLVEWLKELKQLREQTRWTPVSEGLPTKDDEYLLYGRVSSEDEECYRFLGDYDAGAEAFGYWQERYDDNTLGSLGCEFEEYAEVIAWMPLPDSYKTESEVEERKKTDDSIKIKDEAISEYNVKSIVFKDDDFDNLDSMLEDLWNDTESETNK